MYGFGLVEWTHEIANLVAYIQTLEVIPDGRGRGVGGELLRRLTSSAFTAGASSIWLHVDAENAGAIRLYEKNGYRQSGREEDYYGRGSAGLIYVKHLCAPQEG